MAYATDYNVNVDTSVSSVDVSIAVLLPYAPSPVLDLDCFNYEDGSGIWPDASGNGYDFEAWTPNGGHALPIKNADGTITLGRPGNIEGYELKYRSFSRTAWTSAELGWERYIPFTDTDFSWEFIFRYTPGENNGWNLLEPWTAVSANYTTIFLGYANHGRGGWSFGSSHGQTDHATDPESFIPWRGYSTSVYGGHSSLGSPPSSSIIGQYGYDARILNYDLDIGLDPSNGLGDGTVFVFTFTMSVSSGINRMYVNGVLNQEATKAGIGMWPDQERPFRIGLSTHGGLRAVRGIDVFMFRAYEEYLSPTEVAKNYSSYVSKYNL